MAADWWSLVAPHGLEELAPSPRKTGGAETGYQSTLPKPRRAVPGDASGRVGRWRPSRRRGPGRWRADAREALGRSRDRAGVERGEGEGCAGGERVREGEDRFGHLAGVVGVGVDQV